MVRAETGTSQRQTDTESTGQMPQFSALQLVLQFGHHQQRDTCSRRITKAIDIERHFLFRNLKFSSDAIKHELICLV